MSMNSPSGWELQFVLPNIQLSNPVEEGWIAIVPHDDPRLANSCSGASGQLLLNFSGQFGEQVRPAALITQSRITRPPIEAIVSFRDVVAISVIVQSWAAIAQQHAWRAPVLYSDSFDFYPITPSIDNQRLHTQSPAILRVQMPGQGSFSGQPSPSLQNPASNPVSIDIKIIGDTSDFQSHPCLGLFRDFLPNSQSSFSSKGHLTLLEEVFTEVPWP